MGFWNWFRRETRAEDVGLDDVLLKSLIGGSQVDEKTAMSIPAFAACVDFIADTVAGLPVKLFRDCEIHQTAEEVPNDERIALLNDDGGDLLTAYEAKRAQVKDMLLYGAGYMFIQRNGAAVKSLRYVKRQSVGVSVNSDPIFKEANISINGRYYFPWEFVIITRESRDGVTGKGLLEQISGLLNTAYNEMLYENAIAKTGGNKKGFLMSEKKLSQDALNVLKKAWQELYSNSENNMMVLNDGVKYAQTASTSVEMQLNEHKLTNAEMIAQSFGLSSDVISGKTSTEGFMSAVRSAVVPIVEEYQAALNRSLLLESEKRGGLYFVLDTSELLKGDMVSRFNAYSVGLQNNIMSIDEVRYRENLPPLGFNYMKLGLADVLYDPQTGRIITPNTGLIQDAGLTNGLDNGIINEDTQQLADPETRQKSNWVKGKKGLFAGSVPMGEGGSAKMSRKEYNRVSSEIFTNKPLLEAGAISHIYFENHYYKFEVVEPGTYRFVLKEKID